MIDKILNFVFFKTDMRYTLVTLTLMSCMLSIASLFDNIFHLQNFSSGGMYKNIFVSLTILLLLLIILHSLLFRYEKKLSKYDIALITLSFSSQVFIGPLALRIWIARYIVLPYIIFLIVLIFIKLIVLTRNSNSTYKLHPDVILIGLISLLNIFMGASW